MNHSLLVNVEDSYNSKCLHDTFGSLLKEHNTSFNFPYMFTSCSGVDVDQFNAKDILEFLELHIYYNNTYYKSHTGIYIFITVVIAPLRFQALQEGRGTAVNNIMFCEKFTRNTSSFTKITSDVRFIFFCCSYSFLGIPMSTGSNCSARLDRKSVVHYSRIL